MSEANRHGAGRFEQLDALRGLAALSVLFSHLMICLPWVWNTSWPGEIHGWKEWVLFTPLRLIWAGQQAVIFFFVLSGFVLSLPFWRGKKSLGYKRYSSKRVLRIYPPYIAAVLLAMGAYLLLAGWQVKGLSDWFYQSWDQPLSIRVILDHVLMLGSFQNNEYDPVLWSLIHEMRISLIFPLLMVLLTYRWWTGMLLAFGGSCALWVYYSAKFRGWIQHDTDWVATLHYIGFFIAGALVARKCDDLVRVCKRLPRWALAFGWMVAILLYTHSFWLRYFLHDPENPLSKVLYKHITQEWIETAAVIWIIVAALQADWFKGFLMRRIPQFFGKISYSLYLVHAIVLKVVVLGMAQVWSYGWSLLLAIPLSILVSWGFWWLFERPSMGWSKAA